MTSTRPTERGVRLAARLNPWIGTTYEIERTCSLIARHARTYSGIQERWCCVPMTDAQETRLAERETRLEDRIRALANLLPWAEEANGDRAPWLVDFQGDPRGRTVILYRRGTDPLAAGIGCDD